MARTMLWSWIVMWKGLTLFSLAGAAIAVVPTAPRETVLPLTRGAVDGTIDVVSFGVAQLSVDDRPLSALHVRETFANRGDHAAWTVELAASTVAIPGVQDLHPILLNSDVRNLPIARIGRGEHHVVDLYFPLAMSELPTTFTVTYRLDTPDHRFRGRAELVRATRTAQPSEWLPALGSGAAWWASPDHTWPSFRHVAGRITQRTPVQIRVTRAPHALFETKQIDEEWPRTDECDDW